MQFASIMILNEDDFNAIREAVAREFPDHPVAYIDEHPLSSIGHVRRDVDANHQGPHISLHLCRIEHQQAERTQLFVDNYGTELSDIHRANGVNNIVMVSAKYVGLRVFDAVPRIVPN